MIDTHCHLDLPIFADDVERVVERARAAGVSGILVPAIRPSTWAGVIALCRRLGPVAKAAIGVHPQVVPELTPWERDLLTDAEATLMRAIQEHRDVVVAVGECGVDGGTAETDEQKRLFEAHLGVASALDLPLVIHVLRAHDVAIRLLQGSRGPVRGVLHSYSGSPELVPGYQAMGLHFSFAGAISYPNAKKPDAAARLIAEDRLLAETDSPDQSPFPVAGSRLRRNEPGQLAHVIEALAAARGTTPAAVAQLTASNARRLFGAWS